MTSKLAKIVGMAAITALSFGKPDVVYAPNISKEIQKEYFDDYLSFIEKKKFREEQLAKYSQFIGKPLIDKWVQETIDRIKPHNVINTEYVLATMKQESTFKPYAKSPAGARGLMQVMPATWNWIEGDGSFYKDSYNPDRNLEVGIKNLDRMAKFCERNYPYWGKLDDSEKRKLISAAYNGGNGTLQKSNWNINKMPKETRGYVPNVLRYYNEFEEILK